MIPDYDKYAPYIWVCFGVTVLALIGLLIVQWSRAARAARELEALDTARGGVRR